MASLEDVKGFNSQSNFRKAWLYFVYFWLVFGVGTIVGSFLPPAIIGVVGIGLFVILFISLLSRKQTSFTLNTIFSVMLGVVSYLSFAYYLEDLGTTLFFNVVVLALVGFVITGLLGYFVFKDTSNWGHMLLMTLIALVIMSFVGIFIMNSMFHLILSVIGLGLFLLYNIYDFNRLKRKDYEPMEMGFNLFINLLNLILDALRIVSILKD